MSEFGHDSVVEFRDTRRVVQKQRLALTAFSRRIGPRGFDWAREYHAGAIPVVDIWKLREHGAEAT